MLFRLIFLFLLTNVSLFAQKPHHFWSNDTLFNETRFYASTGGVLTGSLALYTYLGVVWYGELPKGRFHTFNDFHEWKQMDKFGHCFSAYQESRGMITLLKWSGVKRSKVILWGGLTGFLLQSPIEIFDGFSPKWGASWGDLGANALGSSLAITNELLWNEQRFQLKFFFFPSDYAQKYPEKLGKTIGEQLFKDYNGQTYWLSCRLHSFLPDGKFKHYYPRWLNISVGYGAKGLIGGYGYEPQQIIDSREYRRILIGIDIDLANIRTKSGFLKALLGAANTIHIPLPAIEISKNGVRGAFF